MDGNETCLTGLHYGILHIAWLTWFLCRNTEMAAFGTIENCLYVGLQQRCFLETCPISRRYLLQWSNSTKKLLVIHEQELPSNDRRVDFDAFNERNEGYRMHVVVMLAGPKISNTENSNAAIET